jgi:hypothetical protein
MTTSLVEAHQADLATLTRQAERDLAALWQHITSPDVARDVLMDVLPDYVSFYGSAAATLGADWYDELREAEDVPGSFRAIPVEPPDREQAQALARWGIGPLFQPEPNVEAALTLLQGGLQRIVANADRDSVALSAIDDPRADGWQRLGIGANCGFCNMLISRGAVYTKATVRFGAHDHCNCYAAPAFKGHPRRVLPYKPTERLVTDADRARLRDYLNDGKPPARNVKPSREPAFDSERDVDLHRSTEQLRETLRALQAASVKSPATLARIEDLRRKIAARA